MAADSTTQPPRAAYHVAALTHIGLMALIAALVAFVLYTSRPRRLAAKVALPFSMTPPRVEPGEFFTITVDYPARPVVDHAYLRVVCYSTLRTVLWKRYSGGAFFAQRDDSAPPGVQRLLFKGRFPSEAELWSNDVNPYATWIWRIEASSLAGGIERNHSFEVLGREPK